MGFSPRAGGEVLYELCEDARARLATAILPFGVGMNYNLEYGDEVAGRPRWGPDPAAKRSRISGS